MRSFIAYCVSRAAFSKQIGVIGTLSATRLRCVVIWRTDRDETEENIGGHRVDGDMIQYKIWLNVMKIGTAQQDFRCKMLLGHE